MMSFKKGNVILVRFPNFDFKTYILEREIDQKIDDCPIMDQVNEALRDEGEYFVSQSGR